MPSTVEETDTQTQTDPSANKSTFGEFIQERLEEKTDKSTPQLDEPAQPEKPAKEPAAEPAKPAKEPTATTPVGDVLDAALSGAAAKSPTEEKATSPVDEFENVTDGVRSEEVKKRMVGMREKIKSLWQENQTIARERGELQGKVRPALEDPEVQALVKAKDEELNRANEALLALNIDSHPEFQREFTQPREKLARSAAQKLQSYGGNGQGLLDALYMPEGIRRDEAVAQLLENVPDYAKTKITGIVTEIEGLDDRAQEKRANAPKTWQELSARDLDARRKKAEEYQGQVKGLFEKVKGELSDTPFFREFGDDIKGASEWNKERSTAFERGLNHILGSDNTIERSMVTAIKGERFDGVAKMLTQERATSAELRKKLAEYEGVQPTVRGSRAPAGKEADEDKDVPFGEIVARRAARRSEDSE